jgi:hypothetical protein
MSLRAPRLRLRARPPANEGPAGSSGAHRSAGRSRGRRRRAPRLRAVEPVLLEPQLPRAARAPGASTSPPRSTSGSGLGHPLGRQHRIVGAVRRSYPAVRPGRPEVSGVAIRRQRHLRRELRALQRGAVAALGPADVRTVQRAPPRPVPRRRPGPVPGRGRAPRDRARHLDHRRASVRGRHGDARARPRRAGARRRGSSESRPSVALASAPPGCLR